VVEAYLRIGTVFIRGRRGLARRIRKVFQLVSNELFFYEIKGRRGLGVERRESSPSRRSVEGTECRESEDGSVEGEKMKKKVCVRSTPNFSASVERVESGWPSEMKKMKKERKKGRNLRRRNYLKPL
jgi:hypothetical protein